jgi:hypothetical protein
MHARITTLAHVRTVNADGTQWESVGRGRASDGSAARPYTKCMHKKSVTAVKLTSNFLANFLVCFSAAKPAGDATTTGSSELVDKHLLVASRFA